MRKSYEIKGIDPVRAEMKEIWGTIPDLDVDCYPWVGNDGYTPNVKAKLFYTQTHFYVSFRAYEEQIRADYSRMNDPVCRDSCVEFFFNPNPEGDNRYMNFEMNPIGTLLVGIGKDRHDRNLIPDVSMDIFQVTTSVHPNTLGDYEGPFWTVEYSIPFTLIEKYYGKLDFQPGWHMKGNFYKCGDDTAVPHFGCWNCVVSLIPDFHRPECFGDLILGK